MLTCEFVLQELASLQSVHTARESLLLQESKARETALQDAHSARETALLDEVEAHAAARDEVSKDLNIHIHIYAHRWYSDV